MKKTILKVYAAIILGLVCGASSQAERLDLKGKGTHLLLTHAWTPGPAYEDWLKEDNKIRAEGLQLPEPLEVARLSLRYTDNTTEQLALRHNESIGAKTRDWWNPNQGFIYHLPFAKAESATPLGDGSFRFEVTYTTELPNPHPDKTIESAKIDVLDGSLDISAARLKQVPVSGKTYFVAPDGDDEASGTWDAPWATLQHAAKTIAGGDTVYVRGGLYQMDSRVVFKHIDAAEAERTLICGWPGETPTFDFMNVQWDLSKNRKVYGFEATPHDTAMIVNYCCDRMTFKNLTLRHSRARGFSLEAGFHNHFVQADLINNGRPDKVVNEDTVAAEILYCTVYRTFGPGIRFANQKDGRAIGNRIIRGCSASMSAKDGNNPEEILGMGPTGRTWLGRRYGAGNTGKLKTQRKAPMESFDSGHLINCEIAYNEIAWNDAECMLVDGNVSKLRIHHNYVHNAWNTPWIQGIAPNGYGHQEFIEVDHNIAHNTGIGFGFGLEGGGTSHNNHLHHNLSFDQKWTSICLNFGGEPPKGDFKNIIINNNTEFRSGDGGPQMRLKQKPDSGITVDRVAFVNNLILEPSSFALKIEGLGDLKKMKVTHSNNLSDSGKLIGIPSDKRTLEVYTKPLVIDPEGRDFRLLPNTPAVNTGLKLDNDLKPTSQSGGTIGAFGPEAKWVELK
jgi:hypothetical protein